MVEENLSQKFKLKNIDKIWNYFIEEIEKKNGGVRSTKRVLWL